MKIDHVHFYCRNAARTRDWFIHQIGFKGIGNWITQDTHTELVSLNAAHFLISAPLTADSPVGRYLARHPAGVADIAFRVQNLAAIIERAPDLGVEILQQQQTRRSPRGDFKLAQINGWQDLRHTLIETTDEPEQSSYLPVEIRPSPLEGLVSSQITNIDHVVLNVAQGQLNSAVKLYQKLFDLRVQQSFLIQTDKSGLTSQALIDATGEVQFNINQPTDANSQIQEFIDFNHGSGIQHLALRSPDLIADVARLQRGGLTFLDVPQAYYQQLESLSSLTLAEQAAVKKQQILVDSDRRSPQSLLMQIFTQPIFEQPTFFLEFIERRQSAQGFGQGNFKALFEAVERQSKHRPPIPS
ncbi:MAG: 4-hydroxyphenylpyruvate dioxygenase [Cyanobacteria bacterium J06555_3]